MTLDSNQFFEWCVAAILLVFAAGMILWRSAPGYCGSFAAKRGTVLVHCRVESRNRSSVDQV
jgi:hypothetical protein